MFLTTVIFLAFAANDASLPPGKGQEIVQKSCVGCHALKVVTSKRASKEQWSALVDQMVSRGADIPDEDIETVVEYLFKNFGPADPNASEKSDDGNKTVNVNKATATELAGTLGISGKDADAIVAYRDQKGIFKEWRDLANVPGIETKKIESNKDRITF
ncbi:MAG: uptake protein and related DNA-binding protein-like protein [Acidobacteriaceae bacterium]|jgi:competence ComEA-like helix-hairpin-helix protein|nr:uptake protein and related DNA-binding protein-like protein [Acidobacteriaceae bacterium]